MISIVGIIIALILMGAFAGLIVLQVKLSRKETTMPGLILPIISLVMALLLSVLPALFAVNTSSGATYVESGYIDENGEYYVTEEDMEIYEENIAARTGVVFVTMIIMSGIPFIVFTIIYFACHRFGNRKPKQAELDKMSINDLE